MKRISRRDFALMSAGFAGIAVPALGQEGKKDGKKDDAKPGKVAAGNAGPVEAAFERDYPPPGFKPGWKKQQLNRQLVQDFVIYAHSDLSMTQKLLKKEPGLINSYMDWGAGDWESGLGGASHMGRHDIVEFLLGEGARIDLFCAAMMGMLEVVKTIITLQPKLIDARGPHGFNLHFHAQVGDTKSAAVLDYLQTVKKIEMKPNPILESMKKNKK